MVRHNEYGSPYQSTCATISRSFSTSAEKNESETNEPSPDHSKSSSRHGAGLLHAVRFCPIPTHPVRPLQARAAYQTVIELCLADIRAGESSKGMHCRHREGMRPSGGAQWLDGPAASRKYERQIAEAVPG
jgi:hypothetical protein